MYRLTVSTAVLLACTIASGCTSGSSAAATESMTAACDAATAGITADAFVDLLQTHEASEISDGRDNPNNAIPGVELLQFDIAGSRSAGGTTAVCTGSFDAAGLLVEARFSTP